MSKAALFPARDLLECLVVLLEIDPDARLTRNLIGNLAIYDLDGCFTGWLDLEDPSASELPSAEERTCDWAVRLAEMRKGERE